MPDTPAPAPAERTLAPGTAVAGYRLLRQVAGSADPGSWLARAPGEGETRCVTLQRATEALNRLIAAHTRISSPHVLALVDLATDSDGRVVLVWERTDWTLATLLASRAQLAPGEAVTVLAPLAAGLEAIHSAGLSHGELTPASVIFCPDGRPVLGRLDAARKWQGAADERPSADVLADYRSLGALIAAVAQVVEETARPGFLDIADWISDALAHGSDTTALLGQVECRLFAVAPALPVVLVADRLPAATRVASRRSSTRTAAFSVASARRATEALPGLRSAAAALAESGVIGWVQRVLRGRALALCLGIVLLIATLLAGLAAVPESPTESISRFSDGERTRYPTPAMPTDAAPTTTSTPTSTVVGEDDDDVRGSDPVAAALVLLQLRARCVAESAAACVSHYAEPGSALAVADAHAVRRSGLDTELLVDDASASAVHLVQSYGNAVLLRASSPANEKRQPVLVLVVRTDTGWRLRDVFEPD